MVCYAFLNRLITKLGLKDIYGPYMSQNIGFCHEVLGISPVDIRKGVQLTVTVGLGRSQSMES